MIGFCYSVNSKRQKIPQEFMVIPIWKKKNFGLLNIMFYQDFTSDKIIFTFTF